MIVRVTHPIPDDLLAELRAEFPAVAFHADFGPNAGAPVTAGTEALFCARLREEDLPCYPALRWVQVWSAGVEHLPFRWLQERGVTLTNASGAHGPQISENILGLMLAFATRLPTLLEAQRQRLADRHNVWQEKFVLDGATLLIAGLGGIGSALAPRAKALGMRVLGVRRGENPPPEGVEEIVPRDGLLDGLARADHVALCLPLTPETTGFLGERELRAMKPSAYLYNAGRGKSVQKDALVHALREGWIAGAGLDVTDPEPLPPDDPLWEMPNVILTQHTSGSSPANTKRVLAIFRENLRRFLKGEPLMNVVDYGRGY